MIWKVRHQGSPESLDGLTAEQIIDAGDRVVTVESWRARGKASGAEAEARQASVWTISDGKITRIVGYADPAEALEAAGLRE